MAKGVRKKSKQPGDTRSVAHLGPSANSGWRPFAKPWVVALSIFAVSFALYANTLGHDFVWDDHDLIAGNQAVRTLDLETIQKIFTQDFWPRMSRGGIYYRPLVTLSYHIDYQLGRGSPTVFHWVNVLFNAATCAAAFVFVYVLFRSVWFGLLTALLFTVHPIHTESVAWIAGRTDIFASLWALVSLSFYVVARRRGRVLFLTASLVAFMLAMLAKEIAACVLLLVVILEFTPCRTLLHPSAKVRPSATANREKRSFVNLMLFLGVAVLYMILRHQTVGSAVSTNSTLPPGATGHVALPLALFAGYIYKVMFPLTLTAEYTVAVPSSLFSLQPLAGMVLAAVILYGAWRFRRHAEVLLGVAIFLLGLAPVLHLVPIAELSAERFLYFPSLGFALILGRVFASALMARYPGLQRVESPALPRWWRVPRPLAMPLVIVLTVVVALLAVKTVTRNTDWKNDEVLFAKTVEQAPDSPRVLVQLGLNAHKKGDLAGAVHSYEKALQISPDYPVAHFNLGLIRLQQGDSGSARAHLQQAVRGGPDFRAASYHLAVLEKAAGNTERAKQHAQRFLLLYDRDDPFRREAEAILRGD
ncbi:MAG: tetratricopeptide repeat protein [Candidatus Krumholzibacteria bacterium]|nr:tetratricopeptide repeat protein [Candidatus Krumholzibacteria bacterium]